ncbi:MAG: DUF2088 domain-containing protein, partial [Calditrichia bacterium]|nr:DUF2088 domain-containing protein [Calditrichia bacterium]
MKKMKKMKTKKIVLSYGSGNISFSIPEKNIQNIIKFTPPKVSETRMKNKIKSEVDNFLKSKNFADNVLNKKVCLIVPDGTRDLPLMAILQSIKPVLNKAKELMVIIATGTHSPDYEPTVKIKIEIENYLTNFFTGKFTVVIHDSRNHKFKSYGKTSRNTPVLINQYSIGYDSYILLSDVKPHYFAGYSNPLKLIIPGIAAYESTEHNHSFALNPKNHANLHPLHPDKERRENEVAIDMLEAFELFFKDKSVFVAGVVSYHTKAIDFYLDTWDKTIPQLLLSSDSYFSYLIKAADLTILSCGGYPADASLYSAQRALELSVRSFSKNSTVILIAECSEQFGHPETKKNFLDLMYFSLEELESKLSENYLLYSHKALRLKKMRKFLDNLYMVTKLRDEYLNIIDVQSINENSLTDFIAKFINDNPDAKINIIDDGAKMAAI